MQMCVHTFMHYQVLGQLFDVTNFKNAPFFVARMWSLRTGFFLTDKQCLEEADIWRQPSFEYADSPITELYEAAKV